MADASVVLIISIAKQLTVGRFSTKHLRHDLHLRDQCPPTPLYTAPLLGQSFRFRAKTRHALSVVKASDLCDIILGTKFVFGGR